MIIAIDEVKSTIALKSDKCGLSSLNNVKEALSIVDHGFIIYNGKLLKKERQNY